MTYVVGTIIPKQSNSHWYLQLSKFKALIFQVQHTTTKNHNNKSYKSPTKALLFFNSLLLSPKIPPFHFLWNPKIFINPNSQHKTQNNKSPTQYASTPSDSNFLLLRFQLIKPNTLTSSSITIPPKPLNSLKTTKWG